MHKRKDEMLDIVPTARVDTKRSRNIDAPFRHLSAEEDL